VNTATVLIVDDNPSHLKLYSWIVAQRGWKAATALVGSTRVNLPESIAVDVILLDYRLASELKATEVAKLLKQAYPLAPIIVLSEMPWMPDEMRGQAAAFVHKGEPQRLLDTLEAIMNGRLPAAEEQLSAELPKDLAQ
jgi:DNA-binding NtrC family response regulator